LFLNNKLNTNSIKKISVKDIINNEWAIVWDREENLNQQFTNIIPLSLVTFKTNQMRFELEFDDISNFLPPFSIGKRFYFAILYPKCIFFKELQGLYTADETRLSNESFVNLLYDEKFSDIEFLVENKAIKAHKCIIAMRSPYWKDLFEENVVFKPIVIENISYNAFKLFLKYLYTSNLDNGVYLTPEILAEIILLSNQYEIFDLKDYCLNIFYNFLADPSNIMDLYNTSVNYSLDELTDVCLKAIAFNFELLLKIRIPIHS
jgi:hypothetical protein